MADWGHNKILEYAISSLLRKKYKNLAIIVVFSILIAIISSILFLTNAFKVEAMNTFYESPEIIVQRLSVGRHDLIPLNYVDTISAIAGVGKVQPRYWGYYYDSLTRANYTVVGLTKELPTLKLLNGKLPQGKGECAVGFGVAKLRRLNYNDSLFLTLGESRSVSFKTVGIFDSTSAMLTNDLIIMDKDDLIDFFDIPKDRATDLVVEVYNDTEIQTVARKIAMAFPDTRVILKGDIIRTYDSVFNWRGGMIVTMFFGALLAFAIFVWDKATGLSASEKQEIGILKAIGWETSDVLKLKFWEGTVVSLVSFLTGLILAYIHVFLFGAVLFGPVLKGWSVLFPPFQPIPYINIYHVFSIFFLTVVPYVVSTVVPSWKAAITDPDTIMRM
ncbi:MAG: FtsX-like permease family protein [Nitrospirae bacterium]|nr:FtsX-like permease family protein [Nitrospirota bacterium]MBF0536456.1 FtsX-like permease family protein [Nitrospirota bacterium]MBF0618396.1 FtsX-like permease family protein [Nitrospirota bacterium]